MDLWETSNLTQSTNCKKWEGEDVEDNVADSWDQEITEDEIFPVEKAINKVKHKTKPSKQVKNEIPVEIQNETLTAEGIKKLQLEADLHLAKEVFGVQLDTKEDYDKLKDQLIKVLNDANKNVNFSQFSEDVIQFLCSHLSSNDLRKIQNWIGNLQIQKTKQERGEKKKSNTKAKSRAKIRLEDGDYDFTAIDCDDFI